MKEQNTLIDERIIKRLHQNDESALTELYSKYWQYLYITSYNVLRNKELCEDIVQEVFLSVWNRRMKLQIKVSLKSYLYACTRYQVFAQLRKNKEILRTDLFTTMNQRIHYASTDAEIIYKELVQQVDSVVETLPNKCKKVYILSRNEHLSHLEISSRLHISTKTVENHITKALRILKKSLGVLVSIILFLCLWA